MSQTTKEAYPSKPEEQEASNKSASWPALPGSSKAPKSIPSDSSIPPGQKPTEPALLLLCLSLSTVSLKENIQEAVDLYSTDLESISDFQLQKTLKPLLDLEK